MAGTKKAGDWDEAYDPSYFAKKHGLTEKQAKIVIQSNGPSKHSCDHAARMFVAALKVCGQSRKAPPSASVSETSVIPAREDADDQSLIEMLRAVNRRRGTDQA